MKSVFHRLVTKEDEFTQLLFNLMQRLPDFRAAILGFLLPGSEPVRVEAEQISIQRRAGELGDCGRPDLSVSSEEICAFIEVKVDTGCGLTQSQELESGSSSELKNYVNALATQGLHSCKRSLVYLVPRDWVFLLKLRESIEAQSSALRAIGVSVDTRHWEDILDAINIRIIPSDNQLSAEFRLLLTEYFGPVTLSEEDLKMLFSKDYVNAWATMQKLQLLIDEIKGKGVRSGYAITAGKGKDEYGFYFSSPNTKDMTATVASVIPRELE